MNDYDIPILRRETESLLSGQLTLHEACALSETLAFWRARCHVTAEDVGRVGLEMRNIQSWLRDHGWERYASKVGRAGMFDGWRPENRDHQVDDCIVYTFRTDTYLDDPHRFKASAIYMIAKIYGERGTAFGRNFPVCAQDLLEEMARCK